MAVVEDLQHDDSDTLVADAGTEVAPSERQTLPAIEPGPSVERTELSRVTMLLWIPLILVAILFLMLWPVYSLATASGDVDIEELSVTDVVLPVPEVEAPAPRPTPTPVVATAPAAEEINNDADADRSRPASSREIPIPGQSTEPSIESRVRAGTFSDEPNLNLRFELDQVGFEPGSNEPTAEAKEGLLIVAQYLKDNPQQIIVASHSDAIGDAQFNLQLSQARADLVKERMVNIGVDPELITAVGYGEAQPIASNDTPEGQALNRRIEFLVVATDFVIDPS